MIFHFNRTPRRPCYFFSDNFSFRVGRTLTLPRVTSRDCKAEKCARDCRAIKDQAIVSRDHSALDGSRFLSKNLLKGEEKEGKIEVAILSSFLLSPLRTRSTANRERKSFYQRFSFSFSIREILARRLRR